MDTRQLEKTLKVGTKIKLGEKCCSECFPNESFKSGDIIELVEGYFEYDNGLYTDTQTAPSIWNEDMKEFDSIYHMFENDLSGFLDSEVIN